MVYLYLYTNLYNSLQNDPLQYKKIIPFYLKCLSRNTNQEVLKDFVKYSYEIYPFCNEYTPELLLKLFKLKSDDAMTRITNLMKF